MAISDDTLDVQAMVLKNVNRTLESLQLHVVASPHFIALWYQTNYIGCVM